MREEPAPSLRRVVALAGSAGSVALIVEQLRRLTFSGRSALFVLYHRNGSVDFRLEAFAPESQFTIAAARHGEPVRAGHAYYPWRDHDLRVVGGRLVVQEPQERHRPSIDRLLGSLAREYGPRVTAALLSGMGRDGVAGALAVRAAGGRVLVQDPRDASFPHLPEAVLAAGAPHHVLPWRGLDEAVLRDLGQAPGDPQAGATPTLRR